MVNRIGSGAAAALLAAVGACASPEPRYPVALDPLSTSSAAPAQESAAVPPEAAAPAPAEPAPAADEVETPRAAPVGTVESAPLSQLPAAKPPAPPVTAPPSSPQPAPAPSGLSHVVGPGDTFYAIARRYGVGPLAVAEVNGLTFADTLRLGQRVQLPAGAVDRGPEAARAVQPAPAALAPQASVAPAPAPPAAPAALPEPMRPAAAPTATPITPPPTAAVQPAPTTASPVPADPAPAPAIQPVRPSSDTVTSAPAGATRRSAPAPVPALPPVIPTPGAAVAGSAATRQGVFAWPLRGDLISGFGPGGAGQRRDGVNIAAAEGDPVRAAAAGTVVYAGDQVKGGFGKLVLIEHADRWFTVYAHLSDIGVRMRQKVSQGQELGRAGRTGGVAASQLYFEVRHAASAGERARPVDPIPLLPQ